MEIPIYLGEDNTPCVPEANYFALIQRLRQLVIDQKTALRSHNAAAIADCQKREAAFLQFAADYTTARAKHPNIKK